MSSRIPNFSKLTHFNPRQLATPLYSNIVPGAGPSDFLGAALTVNTYPQDIRSIWYEYKAYMLQARRKTFEKGGGAPRVILEPNREMSMLRNCYIV